LDINQSLGAGNRVIGSYRFFAAFTAVPTGIYTRTSTSTTAPNNVAHLWLGSIWPIWRFLWSSFFLLLALEVSIIRVVGWATTRVAVATGRAFDYVLLEELAAVPPCAGLQHRPTIS
jgi:hypothetical protein